MKFLPAQILQRILKTTGHGKTSPFASPSPPPASRCPRKPPGAFPTHAVPKTALSRPKQEPCLETRPHSAPLPQTSACRGTAEGRRGATAGSHLLRHHPRAPQLARCHRSARPGKLPVPRSLEGHLLVRCCRKTNSRRNTLALLAEVAHDPAMPFLCQLGTPRLGRIPSPERSRYFLPIYTLSAAENATTDF